MEFRQNNEHNAPFQIIPAVRAKIVITVLPESSSEPGWKDETRKNETFECQTCRSVFRRRDHLRRHNKTVHCAEKSFFCHICALDFRGQDILSEHISIAHPSVNKFTCPKCQYIAEGLQAFISHTKTHGTPVLNKHVCTYCKACFKRQDHMNRHVKSLHLKQHVTCDVCKQVFKRQDHLQRHKREQHGVIDAKRLLPK